MKKLWILPVLILGLISMACTISGVTVDFGRIEGSGNVVRENRSVGEFSGVVLSGMGNLYIEQGDSNGIVIEAEDNIVPKITTTLRGNQLVIAVERGMNIIPTKEINYYITMKDVNDIQVLGAGNVDANDIQTDSLNIDLTGLGAVKMKNLDTGMLDITISGAGDINVDGKATQQSINISGAGNYHAEDLESENADIIVSGLGGGTLWAKQQLSVIISGGGNIDYYGDPQISRTISGLGKLTSLGEHN